MSDAIDPDEVLMTEDGHPIGQLVISDGGSLPPMPNSRTVSENREELMRLSAQDITGDPDADAAVAELYPFYADEEKKRRAMSMFVSDGRDINEISDSIGVPGRTIAMWCYNGHWEDLLRKDIVARNAQSTLALARLRADRRLEIAKEQLEQAKELRDKAANAVLNDETSIKSGTEAWAIASKIEHTITGVSEAGSLAGIDGSNDDKKQDNGGKVPLVMVFQGGLPPVRKAQQ